MPRRTPRNYHDQRWIELAFKIRQRENHKCEICGEQDTRNGVHHDFYKLQGELWDVPQAFLHLLCDFDHHRTEEEIQELRRALGGPKGSGANWMDIQALVQAIDQARILGRSPKNILEICRLSITPDEQFLKSMERELQLFTLRQQKKAA